MPIPILYWIGTYSQYQAIHHGTTNLDFTKKDNDILYIRDDNEEEDHSKNADASGKRVSERKGKEIVIAKKAKTSTKKRGPIDLYMFQE